MRLVIIEVAESDTRPFSLIVTSLAPVDFYSKVCSGNHGVYLPKHPLDKNFAKITAMLYTSVTPHGNRGNCKYPIFNCLMPIS